MHAQYVIGADGGKTVGSLVGVNMLGPEPFVDLVSIHFRADLSPYLDDDDAQIRLFVRPKLDGGWQQFGIVTLGPERWDRHANEYLIGVTLPIEEKRERETYDETRAIRDIRASVKLPDLDVEIVTISHWLVQSVVAERYQFGRVFLAGDAAHRHSPMGGLGLNTAIQDSHNLAWKLAMVVSGAAEPALLDSYDVERQPVGARNVEFSTFAFFNHLAARAGFGLLPGAPPEHNQAALTALFADTLDGATRRARLTEIYNTLRMEFQAADVEFGFAYGDSPVVVPDGTPAPPRDPTGHTYVPTARPGHRLPHAWLDRENEAVSTHDLVGLGTFVLLTGARGQAWHRAAAASARRLDVPLVVHSVGEAEALHDREGRWATLRGHADGGAILVRPDGHIAFRAATGGSETERLDAALGIALGLVPRDTSLAATRSRGLTDRTSAT